MSDLTDHLVHFARDQLATIKGWQGRAYVERCLTLWAEVYGYGVAASVRQQLGKDLTPAGRGTSSRDGGK